MGTKAQQEKSFKKIRDLNPYGALPYGVFNRFDEYFNLLLNSVKIVPRTQANEQAENEVDKQDSINYEVETYIKSVLFKGGCVGYDKITQKWYKVYGVGINEMANPRELIMLTANGQEVFTRQASYDNNEDGAYIIYATPSKVGLADMIQETTDFMTNCDLAMRQNLEACKTPYIVVVKNEDLRLSYIQALREKQEGQAVILVSEDLGENLKAVNIGVEYLVDRFSEARDRERDTLLNKLGIMTANINKKERVQSAEVNATIGQATDYIYLIIDTFNKQMISYDIPFKMVLNGSLEEIYFDDVDVNDIEDEEGANAND